MLPLIAGGRRPQGQEPGRHRARPGGRLYCVAHADPRTTPASQAKRDARWAHARRPAALGGGAAEPPRPAGAVGRPRQRQDHFPQLRSVVPGGRRIGQAASQPASADRPVAPGGAQASGRPGQARATTLGSRRAVAGARRAARLRRARPACCGWTRQCRGLVAFHRRRTQSRRAGGLRAALAQRVDEGRAAAARWAGRSA